MCVCACVCVRECVLQRIKNTFYLYPFKSYVIPQSELKMILPNILHLGAWKSLSLDSFGDLPGLASIIL